MNWFFMAHAKWNTFTVRLVYLNNLVKYMEFTCCAKTRFMRMWHMKMSANYGQLFNIGNQFKPHQSLNQWNKRCDEERPILDSERCIKSVSCSFSFPSHRAQANSKKSWRMAGNATTKMENASVATFPMIFMLAQTRWETLFFFFVFLQTHRN